MARSLISIIKGLLIQDDADRTKSLQVQVNPSATTGTSTILQSQQTANQTLTLPDATDTLTANNATQTLTNKTLTGNTAGSLLNGTGQIIFNSSGIITVPNPDFPFTDTLVGNHTAATLTNKTITGNVAANLVNAAGIFDLNSSGIITVPNATDTLVGRNTADTLTNKTLSGASASTLSNGSGVLNINSSGTITIPNATDTLVGQATTDTLSNKTLDNTTTETIKDANLTIQNASDTTKHAKFDASGITTGNTRTFTFPDGSTTLVGTGLTQTLTNKTLGSTNTATGINMASFTPDSGTHTLTAPTVTDTLTANAASQTLTNKTIAAGSNTISGLTNSNLSGSAAVTNANLATMADKTVKGNISGSSATPSDVSAVSTATASTVMTRDSSANVLVNTITENFSTTVTSASPVTLTVASHPIQQFTGSTAQTVNLPDCTTLTTGFQFQIFNRSTATTTVKDAGGSTVQAMAGGTQAVFTCASVGTAAGSWDLSYTYSGTLPVSLGGTGQTSYTDGQLLIGNSSGNTLTKATLTAGSNITITNGGGSITVASSGSTPLFTYSGITSDPGPAVVGTFYVASSASFNITLPDAVTAGNIGKPIIIQHGGTSLTQKYTINTTSSQHLHGGNGQLNSGDFVLATNGEVLEVISNGTDWDIISHTTKSGWTSAGTASVSATSAFVFTLSGTHNATQGAIYQDGSGNQYMVTTTISAGGSLTASGPTVPASSGTLTKVSGSGDSSFNWTSKTSTGQPSFGASTYDDISWSREGQFAHLKLYKLQTGAGGAAGSGDYIWYLPSGMQIDTAAVPVYQGTGVTLYSTAAAYPAAMMGTLGGIVTATPAYIVNGFAFAYSGGTLSSFRVSMFYYNSGDALSNWGSAIGSATNTSLSWTINIKVPILGWQP